MGYDLHVVRTLDWLEAARSPITREEVDRLVDQDPELQWSPSDYVDMTDNAGEIVRYPLIRWRGNSCFWWYRDQIISKDPDHGQIEKLTRIAGTLKAQVIGDDGEKYVLRRGLFGRGKVKTIQP
jgi:hypothetical protein